MTMKTTVMNDPAYQNYCEQQAKIKGGDQQPTPVIDELRKRLADQNSYKCPKCGGPMAHFRLHGLKCMVCR